MMLSRPPASLAAAISAAPASRSDSARRRGARPSGPRRPSSSGRRCTAGRRRRRAPSRSSVSTSTVALGAERARDDRALRVLVGLLGRRACPGARSSLDQRVVLGQPLQLAVAQAVGAAVADVRDRRRRARPRSAAVSVVPIPACSASAARQLVDARVGLLDAARRAPLRRSPRRPAGRLEGLDRRCARRPRRPARRPCRRRPRTAARARASESSLARRWRPVSVPAYCSATRSTSVRPRR